MGRPASPAYAQHKSKLLCSTKRCMRPRKAKRSICAKCEQERYRARNPERAVWRCIKDRAGRNKVEFAIPFEVFVALARAAGYGKGSGLHMDRRDATLGYTLDNVQFLTSSENVGREAFAILMIFVESITGMLFTS